MSNNNKNKTIGYWASQEQYSMQDLLNFVAEAEKGGFNTCLTSDHFHPWWHDNGYGNFTWVWMAAAAAERTNNMKFITGVTAAVYRYNPAIIAQAFASLDVLYPGRIGLDGEYFKIKNAKLYTPPSRKIPLYMAAVGEQATKTAAKHTDSLITLTKPDQSKEIFDIFD